jgi:hypothetical protein
LQQGIASVFTCFEPSSLLLLKNKTGVYGFPYTPVQLVFIEASTPSLLTQR